MKVHLFGGVSSPSCASFAFRKCAKDNRVHYSTEAVDKVLRNFYVYDSLKSIDGEKEDIHLATELSQILSKGGFRLTKWITNSHSVLETIPESERSGSVKSLDLERLPVCWDVHSDTLSFEISPTRSGILAVISSLHNPLGFASPCILQGMSLLQDLCTKGLE